MIKKILSLSIVGLAPFIMDAGNNESSYMANLIQLDVEEDYEQNKILKYELEDYQTYKYYIKHIDGKVSNVQELNSIPGKNELAVQTRNLNKGTYWIVLESENEIYTQQLIID